MENMESYSIVVLKEKSSEFVYNIITKKFNWGANMEDVARYFIGVYGNYDRFEGRYLKPKLDFVANDTYLRQEEEAADGFKINHEGKIVVLRDTASMITQYLLDLAEAVKVAKPWSYQEVFAIENQDFQRFVWDSISIQDMMDNLDAVRINTEGIPVNHKTFDKEGNFLGFEKYDCIYEVYEADASKLIRTRDGEDAPVFGGWRGSGKIYAVKCWCTTTNKAHYIWIESQYKDDPLTAIASTFRIHENLIPHIKELKRQGDILLVEMKDGSENVEPEGDIVPLTKEQYFGLLTAQS